MKELSLQETKDLQLHILKFVSSWCEEQSIKCMLCGGTLLGAVRHKGYIPWDDDIDIFMERADYERFLNSFNGADEKIKVLSCYTEKKYPFPFAKIAIDGTLLSEQSDTGFDTGINIDLFPVDGFPSDEKRFKKKLKKITFLRKLLNAKMYPSSTNKNLKSILKRLVLKIIFTFTSLNKISKRLDCLAKMDDFQSSDFAGVNVWGYYERERVNKNIFNSCEKLEFEANCFSAPVGYKEYLTAVYGDYMQLPPIEERKTHHTRKAYVK